MVKFYLFVIKILCISLLFHRKTYLSVPYIRVANMLVFRFSSSSDKNAFVLTTVVLTCQPESYSCPCWTRGFPPAPPRLSPWMTRLCLSLWHLKTLILKGLLKPLLNDCTPTGAGGNVQPVSGMFTRKCYRPSGWGVESQGMQGCTESCCIWALPRWTAHRFWATQGREAGLLLRQGPGQLSQEQQCSQGRAPEEHGHQRSRRSGRASRSTMRPLKMCATLAALCSLPRGISPEGLPIIFVTCLPEHPWAGPARHTPAFS